MTFLVLADGMVFDGVSVGAKGFVVGEIVFNTSLTGYQEILTDPSYFGQVITFTSAHIGNVGVNSTDYESLKPHASGVLFKNFSSHFSNWQAEGSLAEFFKQHQMIAISDIDTRALTLHLREHGSQNGCLVADELLTVEEAVSLAKNHQIVKDSVACLSTPSVYEYALANSFKAHIAVVDCGAKKGILAKLADFPIKLTVVPYNTSFENLVKLGVDGVVLSNGPGDPKDCLQVIELAKDLLLHKIPLFGICLGHQILALAANAQTQKMKFGHHGANHPIQCCKTGAVFISSQNHGYVVDEQSLPAFLEISHRSLFDGTIAGLRHLDAPAFSFQGHPEANPGPRELQVLFSQFMNEVYDAKKH